MSRGGSKPRVPIEPGAVFGRLTVIEPGDLIPGRGYTYLCECSCEKHTRLYVRGDLLRSGETTSCGCLHDELFRENAKKAWKANYVGGTSVGRILTDGLQRNNSSGIRGVSWHKKTKKWQARVAYRGHTYSLGYYDRKEEAGEAVRIAREHIVKDFTQWYSAEYPEQWEKIERKTNKKNPGR